MPDANEEIAIPIELMWIPPGGAMVYEVSAIVEKVNWDDRRNNLDGNRRYTRLLLSIVIENIALNENALLNII